MLDKVVRHSNTATNHRSQTVISYCNILFLCRLLAAVLRAVTITAVFRLLLQNAGEICAQRDLHGSVDSEYPVTYPYNSRFLLDEPDRCRQESPFLVLMIPVAPHNKEARDAIRKTWGKETMVLGRVVSHYFLLGRTKEEDSSDPLEQEILEESQQHHDLLQSDFLDCYKNLTIKTMVMFKWLSTHCPNTSYGMKVDSDMFLNVHNLVNMLLEAPLHLYMTGMVVKGAHVIRDNTSKWYMPHSAFSESIYPPYTMGLGYVFSLDLPKKIVEASVHVEAVYIEDVYVGLCLRHLGIALTDPPNSHLFRTSMPYTVSNCYWTSVITTILDSAGQLLDIWEKYRTAVGNC
uniref:Hexosyltransferase n=1 Tax=Sphaeramia orbicularis TaxID=375764 RepID=A0A673CQ77_9TELE